MKLPRIHARVTIQGTATVQTDSEPIRFDVVNLSAGGALLLNGPAIDVGQQVDLELSVDGGAPLALTGRVQRHESLNAGGTALGVMFIEFSAEVQQQLVDVVNDAYKALGARVLGQLRGELRRRGVTGLSEVADEFQRIREEQAEAHMFSSDLFTERGSDTHAAIVSATTGESQDCVVWSLNLYLGLNREPRVIEKTREAVARYGTGSGTSAPSGGLNTMHQEIARRVADMVEMESAILFPTGYSANLGALSTLPGQDDLILLDRECHASMFDGVRMSGKKYAVFRHNDVADLADKLERYGPRHGTVFVVVESAYSMSGDLAPLREIAALKQRYDFMLYVDEAHTFGFYGDQGRGLCYEMGVCDDVDFIMSTFSKATASSGGFLAAKQKYLTLLQATSTAYIFQACLTPPDAATILAALDEIRDHPEHARRLHENNAYMRTLLRDEGFELGSSQSPVIPVYVPELEELYRLCAHLHVDGIFSVPVTYPAVGANEGRIRFIVNAHHTREQIERTVGSLAGHARALGIIGRERAA